MLKRGQAEQNREPEAEVIVRPMQLEDIPSIVAIEEVSFATPWTTESFTSELKNNVLANYFCLELDHKVIGYIGLWIVMGEGHITNVAIWPGCRGKGWGEYLMKNVIYQMIAKGVLRFTLEVRVSNQAARNLYEKLGFKAAGVRKGYYSDNQEDALIMWASLK
ncbi:ribosomal protein S18-alanine N-acetyltransferase [Dehalobacter sp. TBBPA1]